MSDVTITPPSRPSITVGDGDMGTDDHRDLDHRDAADSHPISAITGLQAALDAAGGGAVDSVNGQTGTVVLDAGDIAFTPSGATAATTVQAAIEEVRDEAAGATDLAWDPATSKVTSNTGTDATLTAVDGSNPGLMTVAQKSKLDGIESGATADQSAAEIMAAVQTLDGPGSGLNADLLDGNEAAAFAAAGHSHSGVYDPAGSADAKVSDTAYDEATWNGDTTHAPSKNAVRDKFAAIDASLAATDLLTYLVAGVTVPRGWGQRWKAGPGKPATQIEDTGGISNSDTSIGLADPGTFVDTANRVARIESEDIFVTAGENTQTITAERGVNGTTAASHSDATHVLLSKVRKVMIWGDSIAQGTYPLGADAWANRTFRTLARRYGGQVGTTWPLYRNTSNISQAGSQEWVVTNGTPLGDTNSSTLSPGGAISFTTGSGNGAVWTRPAGVSVQAFDIIWVDGGTSWDDWSYSVDGGSTWVTNTVPSTSPANPKLKRLRVTCDNPTTIRIRAANAAGTSQVCVLPYECLVTYSTDPEIGVTEGMSITNIGWNGQTLRGQIGARTVTDAVVTNGDATVTSATATFVSGDAGSTIYLNGVSYTILSRTSATEIELSTNYAGVTATGVRASIFQSAGVADHLRIFDGDHGSIVPDLLVMGTWTNDYNYTTGGGNQNVDAFDDYLTFVLERVTPYCDVLLIAPYEQDNNANAALQLSYRDKIEELGAAYDCAVFNMFKVFEAAGYADYAATDAAGFMYDDLHLSVSGNFWMASQLTRLLEVI